MTVAAGLLSSNCVDEETVIPLVAEKLGTLIPPVMVATGPVKDVKL